MAVYKKGGNWFIDFWHRGRRYRRKVSPDKRQAELALKKVKVAIAENKFFDVKKQQKVLFEEMGKEYLERYSKINKRSFVHDEGKLRKHLIPFFGGKFLYEITSGMIEDYKAKRLGEEASVATINRELAILKHIYTKAIEWGKAGENPVKKVKLFRENNQRIRYLERGEVKTLIDSSAEFLKPIIIVALNTGMRQGEILRLCWDDIDFANGIITVRNSKSGESRYVPMNTVVMNTLENLKKLCNPNSPYIFCNDRGRPLTRFGLVRGAFERAVKNTGIKDFHFHDLRHTFASYLVMSGADIMTVKELLGHKTLAMTLRYSHLSPNYKRSTVELLCNRVDTFWTPRQVENTEKKGIVEKLLTDITKNNARVAELVDAQDLKSWVL